jgi:multidrug efflux pump
MNLVESVMHAIRDRLRPIMMTSMAFGLGVLPLAIATGAGSGAQRAIGTGVVGGMLAGTFLGIFFVPLFFVVVLRLVLKERRHHLHHDDPGHDDPAVNGGSAHV